MQVQSRTAPGFTGLPWVASPLHTTCRLSDPFIAYKSLLNLSEFTGHLTYYVATPQGITHLCFSKTYVLSRAQGEAPPNYSLYMILSRKSDVNLSGSSCNTTAWFLILLHTDRVRTILPSTMLYFFSRCLL